VESWLQAVVKSPLAIGAIAFILLSVAANRLLKADDRRSYALFCIITVIIGSSVWWLIGPGIRVANGNH
jgi:hypothetical protein